MAIRGLPRLRWRIRGLCPGCDRSVGIALYLAGGRMPTEGATRLEALCESCGHVWQLPPAEGASATAAPRRARGSAPKE